MLAAIPSVILGFWGILVLAPFRRDHVEPLLHDTLGFIPLFGAAADDAAERLHGEPDPRRSWSSRSSRSSPATSSCAVPADLQDGAPALGADPLGGGARRRPARPRPPASSPRPARPRPRPRRGDRRGAGDRRAARRSTPRCSTPATRWPPDRQPVPGRVSTDCTMPRSSTSRAILLVIGLLSNLLAQWIGRRFARGTARAR